LITPNKREALQLAGFEPLPHAPFPAAEVCAAAARALRARATS
jgi:D-beta-D-heptose 7-phosphate kinase/D-beta-D-heptose 1-phosphate adenosyltransferase